MLAAGRALPALWQCADRVRQTDPQPAECYLTDTAGGHAYVAAVEQKEGAVGLERLRQLDPLAAVRLIVPYTTLACWRMTQGIYRIDPALYAALIDTPLTGDLPASILTRLPEWCIYVETPGLAVTRRDGQGDADLRGVFARIDVEPSGQRNLVLTLDMPAAAGLEAQSLPLVGTLIESIDSGLTGWGAANDVTRAAVRRYAEPIINLLLYLCAEETDITGRAGQPGNPVPKKTRRDGWRLFAAEGPATWDVGVRIGAALRRAYQAEQTEQDGGDGAGDGPKVRPHVRRAHWHGFRSGPRVRPDGSAIPAELRKFDLKWLPPIPVNLTDLDALPAVIRPVKKG